MTHKLLASTVIAFSLFTSAASFASPVGNYDGAISLNTTQSTTVRVQPTASTSDAIGNYGGVISIHAPAKNTETPVAVKVSNNDPMGNYGYGR